ncbi:hypothetical protein AAZX31_10G185300 [Glycine max]|uniref:Glycosyl transferase family 1 domain-containing protein n=2 Tax=Glycine subgen. Soja TaxID=1462606 RepID=K7LKE4_SOYBN|nr:uncharacterized protein LOC100818182 [Glycine max]XP_028182334.1 uncharacterized protein LOC114369322 [Glycine soja]XP_040861764.1 uncharacterized protein LOC100818182 [Glycine max]KAG5004641.1 hypothetical protein JHK86_028780 [Glycine max]KAG5127824.1 hypothetical protein JHK82_028659 [Glycine max]KAG5152436.1 hypothetical protein JHK84_028908 [Glycine max]KAH1139083.1 hypothetical protein GYH30_028509 [Glycine max]KAH1230210.1 D-inositol 3-phosphate glycosyltransferase [Glycine max]|eukprot:XP_003535478.1 uncharacterized protein LOC100818182 [Glycine max]
MNSSESSQQHVLPNPTTTQPFISKFRKFTIHTLSLLVLFTAIYLGFTRTNYFKVHFLKYSLTSPPPPFHAIGSLFSPPKPVSFPSHCVLWMAPFLSGGGYSSEGWSYVLALHGHRKMQSFRLAIEHHGDLESLEFWEGLPHDMKNLASELYQNQCRMNETIVICHSEPGAWYPPLFETFPCPPSSYHDFKSVIGRTMFETDRVNDEHVERCNRMDYVWVPTEFHKSTFVQSGVHPSKVVKIVQPVDVEFFDPVRYKPLDLASRAKLVLGSGVRKSFVFLSVFKWEYRKGWDVLLKSYLKEFSQDDRVALYLLTNPYHTDRDFGNKILDFVESSDMVEPVSGWASVYVIDTHIASREFPRVYRAADAFVLPSRGEGWGRPLVEAMSMALPVIATNWSGPTEFLTEDNSYPLPVDRMSEVIEGPFKGHLWAEPSEDKLRVFMRQVMDNLTEATAKGRKARDDMIRRFSPEIVADIVADHIQNILAQ